MPRTPGQRAGLSIGQVSRMQPAGADMTGGGVGQIEPAEDAAGSRDTRSEIAHFAHSAGTETLGNDSRIRPLRPANPRWGKLLFKASSMLYWNR